MSNLLSRSPHGGIKSAIVCELYLNRESNSSKYHYGNTICKEIKITKVIHGKQKPTMWHGYIIKINKKCKYTNCTNCTNGTNFNDFNKVTIWNLWLLFIIYGFWLFFFIYKLYSHYDMFNSFFLYFNSFTGNKWFDPCRATLVFTPIEIFKHPTFTQCLI